MAPASPSSRYWVPLQTVADNLVRLHSHLGYVSPIEFETNAPSSFEQ
jgi:hypothetical protein